MNKYVDRLIFLVLIIGAWIFGAITSWDGIAIYAILILVACVILYLGNPSDKN